MPVPGDQLQLRLALSELSIAGTGARASFPEPGSGLRGPSVELWSRFISGGCGGTDGSGARISGQHVREADMKAGFVRDLLGRSDYAIIGEIVEPKTRVLDLGCGEGELLEWLAAHKAGGSRGGRLSGIQMQGALPPGGPGVSSDIQEDPAPFPPHALP